MKLKILSLIMLWPFIGHSQSIVSLRVNPTTGAVIAPTNFWNNALTNSPLTNIWTRANPQYYGAKADGITDDTIAVQRALTNYYTEFVGGNYVVTSPLIVNSSNIISYGARILTSVSNGVAIIVGNSNIVRTGLRYELPEIISTTSAVWQTNTGVQLLNLSRCSIIIPTIKYFQCGLQTEGYNAGFAVNTIYLGDLWHNRTNLLLTSTGSGWVNENTFIGGQLSFTGTVSNDATANIIIQPISANNNRFVGISMEGDPSVMVICNGTDNHFDWCRYESDPKIFRFGDWARRNVINHGYNVEFLTITNGATNANTILGEYSSIEGFTTNAILSLRNGNGDSDAAIRVFGWLGNVRDQGVTNYGYEVSSLYSRFKAFTNKVPLIEIWHSDGNIRFGDGTNIYLDTVLQRGQTNVLQTPNVFRAQGGFMYGETLPDTNSIVYLRKDQNTTTSIMLMNEIETGTNTRAELVLSTIDNDLIIRASPSFETTLGGYGLIATSSNATNASKGIYLYSSDADDAIRFRAGGADDALVLSNATLWARNLSSNATPASLIGRLATGELVETSAAVGSTNMVNANIGNGLFTNNATFINGGIMQTNPTGSNYFAGPITSSNVTATTLTVDNPIGASNLLVGIGLTNTGGTLTANLEPGSGVTFTTNALKITVAAAGGSATNAVSSISTNGTMASDPAIGLNFIWSTGITGLSTNRGTTNDIQFVADWSAVASTTNVVGVSNYVGAVSNLAYTLAAANTNHANTKQTAIVTTNLATAADQTIALDLDTTICVTNAVAGAVNLWLTNAVDRKYFVLRVLADGSARTLSFTNASGLTLNVVNTNGFSVTTLPQVPVTANKIATIAGRVWVIAGTTNVDLWGSVQQ